MLRSPLLLVILALSGFAGQSTASAQLARMRLAESSPCIKDRACRSLFEAALRSYQDGDYATAKEAFESAFESSEEAALLIYIGRCLVKLGQYQAALDQYKKYQQTGPTQDSAFSQEVQADIAQAQAQLQRSAPPAPPTATLPAAQHSPSSPVAQLPQTQQQADAGGPAKQSKPFYRRAWFWTLTGTGVAAALGLGLGLGLGLPTIPTAHQTVQWKR